MAVFSTFGPSVFLVDSIKFRIEILRLVIKFILICIQISIPINVYCSPNLIFFSPWPAGVMGGGGYGGIFLMSLFDISQYIGYFKQIFKNLLRGLRGWAKSPSLSFFLKASISQYFAHTLVYYLHGSNLGSVCPDFGPLCLPLTT